MLLLLTADMGIDENRLQVVHVELPLRYNSVPRDQMAVFWRGVLDEIRQIPEVESAAISGNVLLAGMNDVGGVFSESGTRTGRENAIDVRYEVVTDGFFDAIGVPVVAGRPVLSTDITGSEPVVVINEAVAETLWSGAESLGQRVNILGRSFQVVGVVRDFRDEIGAVEVAPQFFVSALQDPVAGALHDDVAILARRRPGTSGVLEALAATVRTFEPEATVTLGNTTEIRWLMTIAERLQAGVVLAIATMATSLAMVGIFGVVAYAVVQRRRETGIRIALGAGRRSVVALMIRFAMTPTLIGLAVGLGLSVAVSELLQGFLFVVDPLDPATFAVAVLLFLAAATIAGVVPARRALGIDPMTVLREE
jgi:ABC-type antimicrobial peptide transport system permease subunit